MLRRAPTLIVMVSVAVAYALTAARAVLGGDNGEFALIFAEGGVPHPSGYPAYALWLRAMSWLPGASPAHGAALATAILGLATVGVAALACRRWGASEPAAAAAAGVYGFSTLAWSLSTHAEVFALHALVGIGIVAAAAPGVGPRGLRRAALLGLLAGIGLSNNHSIVTVAPIGLWGAWLAAREAGRRWPLAVAAGVAAMVVGLLPYAWLASVAAHAGDRWAWGEASTMHGLLDLFLRRDFGTFQLGIYESTTSGITYVGLLLLHLLRDLLWLPPLLGVWAAVASLRARERNDAGVGRLDHLALLATLLLCGPVFVSVFNLDPQGLARHVLARFFLLPQVLVTVYVALGIDRVFAGVRPTMQTPLAVVVVYLGTVVGLVPVLEAHRPSVELYLLNSLRSAPEGAILIGTGDHRLYGFEYVQRALGAGGDAVYVDAQMLLHPWYRQRIESRIGAPIPEVDVEARRVAVADLVARWLAEGRPVYLTNTFSEGMARSFALVPVGTLLEVVPPGAPPPSLFEVEARNSSIFARFVLEPTPPHDPTSWAAYVYTSYARPWRDLAPAFDRVGLTERADEMRATLRALGQEP